MCQEEEEFPYQDIVDLPHPRSHSHPRMAAKDRAAQFAPFAALTGHREAVEETHRQTLARKELDEDQKAQLDLQLRQLLQQGQQEIVFTCFRKDAEKEGGAYVTVTGVVKRVDTQSHMIWLQDGRSIAMRDVVDVQGKD